MINKNPTKDGHKMRLHSKHSIKITIRIRHELSVNCTPLKSNAFRTQRNALDASNAADSLIYIAVDQIIVFVLPFCDSSHVDKTRGPITRAPIPPTAQQQPNT